MGHQNYGASLKDLAIDLAAALTHDIDQALAQRILEMLINAGVEWFSGCSTPGPACCTGERARVAYIPDFWGLHPSCRIITSRPGSKAASLRLLSPSAVDWSKYSRLP